MHFVNFNVLSLFGVLVAVLDVLTKQCTVAQDYFINLLVK